METYCINGKVLAERYQTQMIEEVAQLSQKPHLAVVLVGDHPASLVYVRHKQACAQRIGIEVELFHLSPIMTEDALIAFIQELNTNPTVDGILVQMPLPPHMRDYRVIDAIDPAKDVDGLTRANLGCLFVGEKGIRPCTPLACMALLQSLDRPLSGLHAVVVGRSRLVGKPLAQLLLEKGCTVTQAHSHTRDLASICRMADVLVSATGMPHLIGASHVKKGAIVIDVGIHKKEDGKLCGDVDFQAIQGIASAATPVPGGVGPMTVTMIFRNLIDMRVKKDLLVSKKMVK